MFTEYDNYLFREGTHTEIYKKLGAHVTKNGTLGTSFALWAPHAKCVNVRIEKNLPDVNQKGVEMQESDTFLVPMVKTVEGIWEAFVPEALDGACYRYEVLGQDGIMRKKADPVAFYSEKRPSSLSVVVKDSKYRWKDKAYRIKNKVLNPLSKPMAIYEVHLGSWKKDYSLNEDGFLNYRRLADELSEYVSFMGFTHVELIGICEHPFDGSWGYQVTGYFSPTSRYGTPDDFRYFVDKMHEAGVGVILDWVPAHFPKDSFSFENFDGTPLYESGDPLLAEYPEWGTKAFDHSKPEVRSFLISSAYYWITEFHIDALRVDAVAAMLHTNFSRNPYRLNKFGGTENLESIAFLKQLNKTISEKTSGFVIAEDSSIMAGITKPVDEGGLGFLFKWNLGWMNDTLKYFAKDPVFRGYHHGAVTHTIEYAFTENFILVLSHDEVVHLKKPMLKKMQGSDGDKFSELKALYAYQIASPGKKLLFMGQEFGEDLEWDENREISWHLADDIWHRDVMDTARTLLDIYKKYPVLYTDSDNPTTFEWVNRNDAMRSTFSFIRRNPWNYNGAVLVICNFTPVNLDNYTCGTPIFGLHKRIFSTYDSLPGEMTKSQDTVPLESTKAECDGYENRICYNLRPYETVFFEI